MLLLRLLSLSLCLVEQACLRAWDMSLRCPWARPPPPARWLLAAMLLPPMLLLLPTPVEQALTSYEGEEGGSAPFRYDDGSAEGDRSERDEETSSGSSRTSGSSGPPGSDSGWGKGGGRAPPIMFRQWQAQFGNDGTKEKEGEEGGDSSECVADRCCTCRFGPGYTCVESAASS